MSFCIFHMARVFILAFVLNAGTVSSFLISPDASPCSMPVRSSPNYQFSAKHKANRAVLGRGSDVMPTSDISMIDNSSSVSSLNERKNQSSTALAMAVDDGDMKESQESKSSYRSLVLMVGLGALTCVSVVAKLDCFDWSYTNELILRDAGSSFMSGVLAAAFVKACTYLASEGVLEPRDSRKIIHTLSAPLFILLWPSFSAQAGARYFASIVPLMNGLRLLIAGSSDIGGSEAELANAVSRSGNAKEALGGPFIYVVILFICLLAFWRDSVVGIMAISAMAAGDGMADLAGRRFGATNKWSFAQDKSMAGSLAFFVASTACAAGLISWLQMFGCIDLADAVPVVRIAGIMAACSAVELAPLGDDNWTVPLSAVVLSLLFLQ